MCHGFIGARAILLARRARFGDLARARMRDPCRPISAVASHNGTPPRRHCRRRQPGRFNIDSRDNEQVHSPPMLETLRKNARKYTSG